MSKLKALTRKTVDLPRLTQSALEASAIAPGEKITAIIRKVRANEIASKLGIPPNIYRMHLDAPDNETDVERNARIQRLMSEDGELLESSVQVNDRQSRLILHFGIVSVTVPGDEPTTVAFDPADAEGDILAPSDLGDDFEYLHNEIIKFSSLPYAPLQTAAPAEGDGMVAFPEERVADSDIEDGREVRHDPGRTPS